MQVYYYFLNRYFFPSSLYIYLWHCFRQFDLCFKYFDIENNPTMNKKNVFDPHRFLLKNRFRLYLTVHTTFPAVPDCSHYVSGCT